jgi:hypothetical protein
MFLADLLRGAQAFIGLRRRHPDVHDRDIGFVRADLQEQILGRAGLANDLESLALEQAGYALAQKNGVVGKHDADPRRLTLLRIGMVVVDAQSVAEKDVGLARQREQYLDRRSRQLGFRNEAERGATCDERPEIGAVEARDEDHAWPQLELAKPLRDLESVGIGQLNIDDRQIGTVLLRLPKAACTVSGFGYDDKTASLEQLTCGRAEGCVVVDDQNAATHERILPAQVAIRSVASPTLPR